MLGNRIRLALTPSNLIEPKIFYEIHVLVIYYYLKV